MSHSGGFALDIYNPAPAPQTLSLRLTDDAGKSLAARPAELNINDLADEATLPAGPGWSRVLFRTDTPPLREDPGMNLAAVAPLTWTLHLFPNTEAGWLLLGSIQLLPRRAP